MLPLGHPLGRPEQKVEFAYGQKHMKNKVSIRQKRAVTKCQFRDVSESTTLKMSILVESTFDISQQFSNIVDCVQSKVE